MLFLIFLLFLILLIPEPIIPHRFQFEPDFHSIRIFIRLGFQFSSEFHTIQLLLHNYEYCTTYLTETWILFPIVP